MKAASLFACLRRKIAPMALGVVGVATASAIAAVSIQAWDGVIDLGQAEVACAYVQSADQRVAISSDTIPMQLVERIVSDALARRQGTLHVAAIQTRPKASCPPLGNGFVALEQNQCMHVWVTTVGHGDNRNGRLGALSAFGRRVDWNSYAGVTACPDDT